ncbi:penicillin-binding transpeptidase domain-containing protein [Sphaerisporangium fuscum]|uniref:penicillin-binding transpeptidase domain-containing protein n=1 Tax=Sphaerisporangium fuscum TaxID=2835868 RepID=UPI001BDD9A82|nr:penicillin-binding transpeptidase domain-containing protein [Sphaerisporangium fuscum]
MSLAVAVPLLAACFSEPSPHDAVSEFLVGWQTGDYDAAARRADADPAVVKKALADTATQLDVSSIRFSLKGLRMDGDDATADFHVQIDLGDNNPLWQYDNKLPLHVVDGSWKVRWSPSVIHPKLQPGQRFAVQVTPRDRQPINDVAGNALQTEQDLYVAGVTPASVKNPAELCERLYQLTGFAQDRLLGRIMSAPPQEFVPLVTFGLKKYSQLRDRLDIPGLLVEKRQQPVAPTQPADIIGRVGAITAETEQQLGGPQRAGDTIGQSGLQKAYQDQLTGSTDTKIITLDQKTGAKVAQLEEWPGRDNTTAVRTTIDRGIQQAADLAVSGATPAVLVAVHAPTGAIRAVASRGMDQERDGLAGRFPPGTAFSVVAAEGLLGAGVDPSQKVPCPADRTVGGARFQQATIPAGTAPTIAAGFAQGCVTALASLSRRISSTALSQAASRFGIGSAWNLPLRSFSGSLPAGTSDAAKAKIIAGTSVRVSPLSMALVAGAVASGTWHPPTLVTSPAAPDAPDTPAGTAPVTPSRPVQLDSKTLDKLKALMRAGVTSGSASAAAVAGGKVYGVASTVTYSEKKHQKNLSWFVGWQGDIAVAVLTETSTPAASAQIAGQFFRSARSAA